MENHDIRHFIVRVYGIILNDRKEVLISDEYMHNLFMTKFPGGGLQFGEGPEDCIRREAIEEFGQEIEIISHFYTTGFFQKALFHDAHQLLSIYYKIRFVGEMKFRISDKPFDFEPKINSHQSFRWMPVKGCRDSEFTFPIDRHVVHLLKDEMR